MTVSASHPHRPLFNVIHDGKPMSTPAGAAFAVTGAALAEALSAEWRGQKKFSAPAMPLTALSYTAIDRIAGREKDTLEALLVYVDTDTLAYRSDTGGALLERQQRHWDPVLHWIEQTYGVTWSVSGGIMPDDQSPALHAAIEKRLRRLDAFHLAALAVLASCCSSLALALAVLDYHLTGEEAFRLSRLEEDFQAESWGRDDEAELRAQRLKAEIITATHFLRLLNQN